MSLRNRFGLPSQETFQSKVQSETTQGADSSEDLTIIESMSFKDRTSEFMSAVKLAKQNPSNTPVANGNVNPMKQQTAFTQLAKHIGRDIAVTSTKLEQLILLAKRKTLFDDRSTQIYDLINIIKSDITGLNRQISQLQQLSASSGSKQRQTHSNSVVVSLQYKLAGISNNFKGILEQRTETMKQQSTRKNNLATGANSESTSLLLDNESEGMSLLAPEFPSMDGAARRRVGGDGQQQQIALQQDASMDYLRDRSNVMQEIEQTVVEMGQVFQQLAVLVKEQEEMVHRIDTNVTHAEMNVDLAYREISKYFESVSGNRWLMLKIFGVLIVFFLIFIIFMQ